MEHDLEQLSPQAFQQMCASLALAVFGARLQLLGPGRDGGRDLYFRGDLPWSAERPATTWTGYTVFQVKQKAQLAARPQDNASWLWSQIRDELEAWANPCSNRTEVPDHFIVLTNVPLTPTPQSGGHDKIHSNIRDWIDALDDGSRDTDESRAMRVARRDRMRKLKDWRIWDGVQISGLLTVHDAVRRQFKAFLTVGDILAALTATTDSLPAHDLEDGLRVHARTTLTGDAYVYFDEAGAPGATGTPIQEVVIDLPLVDRQGTRGTAISFTLERGDAVLTPGLALEPGPRHLVIAGAPGSGKTTISKFLVQL